jgi:hypothetical protein
MKKIKYISIFKLGLFVLIAGIAGSSCVKSRAGATDFSNLTPTVLIPEGGLQSFSSQAVLFPGTDSVDTTWFHLNYASTNVAPADESISYAFDPAALNAFNSTATDSFSVFPDSIFSFQGGTATVLKGQNYSSAIPFTVYPSKIDPTKNYMYPITITTAPAGSTISSNFKTIYYHLIGNPIAGAYTNEWKRWNSPDAPPAVPDQDLTGVELFSPVNGTTIDVQDFGTGITYVLTFDNNGGVLSNFQVSLDPASVSAAQITAGSPTIVKADAVHGVYEFTFTYINSKGLGRIIDDTFTKL